MRVSEIVLGEVVRIQTPTDAMWILPINAKNDQEWHRQQFINIYGDVEVAGFIGQHNTFKVPEFAKEIDRYCRNKAKEMAKWG
jgi:hypothetical protein